ncbi:hypothetical protein ACFCYB_33960 [Streptomyces sp. NPDC056309]|uniref:hypothetical protein n=1 Tax=unclassified Streptomyces TaxID=2593676 RepID=UPI0035DF4843
MEQLKTGRGVAHTFDSMVSAPPARGGPQSSSADLLRTIKMVGSDRVGAPWMVMEELAAQQAIKYQELHERAAQALEALRQATPWGGGLPVQLGCCDTERAREHWRSVWGDLVEVIPTSDKAVRQALFREANCLAPCRESKSQKIGSRDAAIWLSAVEYATEHPRRRSTSLVPTPRTSVTGLRSRIR